MESRDKPTHNPNIIYLSGATPYKNTQKYITTRLEILSKQKEIDATNCITIYAFNTSIGTGVTVIEILKRKFPHYMYALNITHKHSKKKNIYILRIQITLSSSSSGVDIATPT